jgi:ankyrin repeat protein
MKKTNKFFLLMIATLVAHGSLCAMNENFEKNLIELIKPLPACHSTIEKLVDSFDEFTLYDGNFSALPKDVLFMILIPQEREFLKKENRYNYPWDECIRVIRRRTVCKRWLTILADCSKIATHLQIPPMHLAAMMGDVDKILNLKFAGHSLQRFDYYNFSPAHYAVGNKQVCALKILKIGCALENKKLCKELQGLVEEDDDNDKSLLHMLSESYAEGESHDKEFNQEREEIFNIIKSVDSELSKKAFTHNKKAILERLFKVTCYFEYRLRNIMRCNSMNFIQSSPELLDRLKLLLDEFQKFGCNPNDCDELGITLIQQACAIKSNLPILSRLLSCKGADLNLKSYCQFTPLHYAVCQNNSAAVALLLSLKDDNGLMLVDIQSKSDHGDTPLHVAVCHPSNLDLIELLINHGAIIDALNSNNETPLHYAASCGKPDCVELLVKHGAFIDSRRSDVVLKGINYGGFTPLHCAVSKKNLKTTKTLIRLGANVTLKTALGKTILDLAYDHNGEYKNIMESIKELPQFREMG